LVTSLVACESDYRQRPPEMPEWVKQAATVPGARLASSVATGLTSPTAIALVPDGRMLLTEQLGKVRVIKNEALLSTPFLDLSAETQGEQERGMLGVTVDPNVASNGYVYI
jgi:glucose/arabinose dehydrogenase